MKTLDGIYQESLAAKLEKQTKELVDLINPLNIYKYFGKSRKLKIMHEEDITDYLTKQAEEDPQIFTDFHDCHLEKSGEGHCDNPVHKERYANIG